MWKISGLFRCEHFRSEIFRCEIFSSLHIWHNFNLICMLKFSRDHMWKFQGWNRCDSHVRIGLIDLVRVCVWVYVHVCISVTENFNIGQNFWTVRDCVCILNYKTLSNNTSAYLPSDLDRDFYTKIVNVDLLSRGHSCFTKPLLA